jgi:hypothetical protein
VIFTDKGLHYHYVPGYFVAASIALQILDIIHRLRMSLAQVFATALVFGK